MADSTGAKPLADALEKNEEATEEVRKAAEQLAVVHAVLDTKVSRGASDGDVADAIAEAKKVEQQLDESAGKLDEVNETLKREVGRK